MRVATAGFDLQSDSGAKSVLQRIRSASTAFCAADEGTRDLGRKLEAWKCREKMTYLAVSKLDAPLVTASYQASGAKPPILLAGR